MKLVVDKDGHAVLKDGMPVYKYDDGSEQPFDAKATLDSLNNKVNSLEEREARHAEKTKELNEKLKTYKDIDLEAVNKNAEIVKKLGDKQLVDEKGIEALKSTMIANFDEEKKGIHTSYKKTIDDLSGQKSGLEKIIFDLAVYREFANDEHFVDIGGKERRTIYPPEDAAKIFGPNFKVEIKDQKVKIIPQDNDGKPIMSKKNHGEVADFHEGIAIMVDKHPRRDDILRSGKKGGPGAGGNLDINSKEFDKLSSTEMIKEGLKKKGMR